MNVTHQSSPYSETFFDAIEDKSLSSARVIVPIVRELIAFRSVGDIGCGRGAWLKTFAEFGAERIRGYDGDYIDASKLLIPNENFRTIDLSKALSVDEHFDLAVCLEVGEHVSFRAARGLVKTLCNMAPAVLFSAAIPGQGGTHHVNERWPAYWEQLFHAYGFCKRDCIRPRIWEDRRIAWWYRQNMFLFVNTSAVVNHSCVDNGNDVAFGVEFDIIPPFILSRYTSVSGLLKELPRAAIRAITQRLT